MSKEKKLTSASGVPYYYNEDSLSAGPHTEDGNWDLVGNNTPIFFIKDPKKFGDFIHTQKRDPYTNCKSPTMMWDSWSLNPESLHQVLFLMSDRGTPYGYRHMHGFGVVMPQQYADKAES